MVLLILSTLFFYSCAGDSSLSEKASNSSSSSDDSSSDASSSSSSTGTVEGKITDGSSGSGISGATVYITGSPSLSDTSDGSGNYSITNAPIGSISVTASKTNFTDASTSATLTESTTTSDVNITLLPTSYSSGKYVVVLTWGQNPADIDAHLYVPNGGPFEVYYAAKGDNDGTLDTNPFAGLDVDDTTSFGPETMSYKKTAGEAHYDGTYRYFVHKFSGTGNLTDSGAVVKVYDSGTLVKTYTVPTSGTGTYWHVFDHSDETITDVNTIQVGKPAAP